MITMIPWDGQPGHDDMLLLLPHNVCIPGSKYNGMSRHALQLALTHHWSGGMLGHSTGLREVYVGAEQPTYLWLPIDASSLSS
jgi:hypothetical protein